MLAVTASKTYSQWLIDNPNFFDDFIEAGDIDEATVLSINKWYKYRVVCDDYKFTDFFERQLDLILPRYNKLVRLENTEFDALVNIYRERQVVGTGSEIGSETNNFTRENSESGSNSKNTTRTPNLTTENEGQTSSTSETDTTNHTEGENSNTSTGSNTSVAKQNPQSISYSGAAVGEIPSLDWQYPSTQSQSENSGSNSGSNQSDGSGSSDTTQSGTSENTETLTGTDTTAETGSYSKEGGYSDAGSKDTEKTTSNTTREIFTGRDSLTPQDALKEAMAYVKTSSAFNWLKEQLEVCFLSVYDI